MLYATIITRDGRLTVLAFFSWLSSLKTQSIAFDTKKVPGTRHNPQGSVSEERKTKKYHITRGQIRYSLDVYVKDVPS